MARLANVTLSLLATLVALAVAAGGCTSFDPRVPPGQDVDPDAAPADAQPVDAVPIGELLAQWSGCMNEADWMQADMKSWAGKGTNGGSCKSCHSEGVAGVFINEDDALMFRANRYQVFITGFFTVAVDPATGGGEVVPAIDKLVLYGSGEPQPHPTYNTNLGDRGFESLQLFYDATRARLADPALCDPPGFPTEPL